MEGWIRLHRKIQEHWLWSKKRKFSPFEAWISLLFKANYKDTKILLNGKIIDVKKGSFITSELKLAEEWSWDRKTVKAFLSTLQNEGMIKKSCTTKWTSVSVEKWALYQFEGQQNGQQNGQQKDNRTDTEKEYNNNLFILLLNKYKQNSPGSYAEKIKKIGEIKNSKEFASLDSNTQHNLFCKLMSMKI